MSNIIDINFNVYSDTPEGKDPDSFSPTLRSYHKTLWSKSLPNGLIFNLDDKTPMLLHHRSELGEFFLSSDSIGHTYSRIQNMSDIVNKVPSTVLYEYFNAIGESKLIVVLFILADRLFEFASTFID